jgi:hypothetical protein
MKIQQERNTRTRNLNFFEIFEMQVFLLKSGYQTNTVNYSAENYFVSIHPSKLILSSLKERRGSRDS